MEVEVEKRMSLIECSVREVITPASQEILQLLSFWARVTFPNSPGPSLLAIPTLSLQWTSLFKMGLITG